ncbi:hypothetical protein AJ90_22465 [Vibrio parahaemolyticus M0605]|nr:hypothetical protein AJ90_22465 [Vibrio parahaemolyticus M0605]
MPLILVPVSEKNMVPHRLLIENKPSSERVDRIE